MNDPLAGNLISEVMGYAAPDLAITLGVASFPFNMAMLSPNLELQNLVRRYCEDTEAKLIGCWAITEPERGSDWIYFNEKYPDKTKTIPQVTAVLKGDEYVLNVQESAWVSNGTIVTHAALFLGIEPCRSMEDCGVKVVPLDLPGVICGKPINKLGQRVLNQGEMFLMTCGFPTNIWSVVTLQPKR